MQRRRDIEAGRPLEIQKATELGYIPRQGREIVFSSTGYTYHYLTSGKPFPLEFFKLYELGAFNTPFPKDIIIPGPEWISKLLERINDMQDPVIAFMNRTETTDVPLFLIRNPNFTSPVYSDLTNTVCVQRGRSRSIDEFQISRENGWLLDLSTVQLESRQTLLTYIRRMIPSEKYAENINATAYSEHSFYQFGAFDPRDPTHHIGPYVYTGRDIKNALMVPNTDARIIDMALSSPHVSTPERPSLEFNVLYESSGNSMQATITID